MGNHNYLRAQGESCVTLRMMSFNIRFDNPRDGLHTWPHRRERVASMLNFHAPVVVGLQEARQPQIADLATCLPHFAWLGVGRDDGRSAGEFVPIFYRLDRLALLDKGHFWLSKTPDVPGSLNWKACCIRMVTWAKFKDRRTHHDFFVFNTHFDQASAKARRKSAALLVKRIPQMVGTAPVVLMGDLNCTESSRPYYRLTQVFQHAKVISTSPHHGPGATFHAFTGILRVCIDYIFIANGIRVLRHATLTDHWGGAYASDHFPVVADILI